ncbi:MAG: hypothetical protein PVS2B2_15140 [Candidatus Acidiferrum sp.]
MTVVAPHAGQEAEHLRAIPAKHEHERAALHGDFRAHLQIIETGNNLAKISRAPVLFIIRKEPQSAIAMVRDFISGGLQAFNQSRGAKRGRRFFAAWQECGSAGWRAN